MLSSLFLKARNQCLAASNLAFLACLGNAELCSNISATTSHSMAVPEDQVMWLNASAARAKFRASMLKFGIPPGSSMYLVGLAMYSAAESNFISAGFNSA